MQKRGSNIMMPLKKYDLNQKSIRAKICNVRGENAERFGKKLGVKYSDSKYSR